ncbi:MAG: hypothetical protein ACM4D3_18675 [Candidatus Sericytochromatia bacterium]
MSIASTTTRWWTRTPRSKAPKRRYPPRASYFEASVVDRGMRRS